MRPLALDLFCGAGGASVGLHRAGFDVIGVDLEPQPRYPFAFVRADALNPPFDIARFDFVWVSPVCKAYSILARLGTQACFAPRQVPQVRAMLTNGVARAWCIENVPGAPLRADIVLEGGQFDLDIIRRRIFEIYGFPAPFALHRQQLRKVSDGGLACVAGKGANNAWNVRRKAARHNSKPKWRDLPEPLKDALKLRNSKAGWCAAMGIDWMSRDELAQAVPPAYAEFIGRAALAHLQVRAA